MRIISGKFKGKTILAPRNLPVRPTTDFAKEALFNILRNQIDFESTKVLDLYCGTGNITYEFTSRGVEEIWAVDLNYACTRFVSKTSQELGFNGVRVIRSEALGFLKSTRDTFDLIFADPPYEFEEMSKIPELVFKRELLNPEGMLIVEHPKNVSFQDHPAFEDQRSYGKVNFSFFTNS